MNKASTANREPVYVWCAPPYAPPPNPSYLSKLCRALQSRDPLSSAAQHPGTWFQTNSPARCVAALHPLASAPGAHTVTPTLGDNHTRLAPTHGWRPHTVGAHTRLAPTHGWRPHTVGAHTRLTRWLAAPSALRSCATPKQCNATQYVEADDDAGVATYRNYYGEGSWRSRGGYVVASEAGVHAETWCRPALTNEKQPKNLWPVDGPFPQSLSVKLPFNDFYHPAAKVTECPPSHPLLPRPHCAARTPSPGQHRREQRRQRRQQPRGASPRRARRGRGPGARPSLGKVLVWCAPRQRAEPPCRAVPRPPPVCVTCVCEVWGGGLSPNLQPG